MLKFSTNIKAILKLDNIKEYIRYQKALAAANGVQATSWQALKGGIVASTKAMGAWLVTNPVGWMVLLAGSVMAAVGVYDLLTTTVEENEKKIEDLTTKIEEQQKVIDDLNAKEKEVVDTYKEYATLMSKSNAYGLSANEKERLLSLSDKLVNTYGLEIDGVDSLTGAYQVGADAIRDYTEALRLERLEKEKEQEKTRNKRIDTNIDNLKKDNEEYASEDAKNRLSGARITVNSLMGVFADEDKLLSMELGELAKYLEEETNLTEENIKTIVANAELYQKTMEEIDTEANRKKQTYAKSVAKDILTNIKVDNAGLLDTDSESYMTQLLTPYLSSDTIDWDKFNKDDFEKKVSSFVSEYSGTMSEIYAKLQNSQKNIADGSMNFSGYEEMYSALQSEAKLLKEMFDDGIIDESSFKQQISQIAQQTTNNIGLAMAEISSKFDETDTKSREAFESVANNFISLENQFKQGTITSAQYLDSLTTTINDMDFTKVFGDNKDAAQQFFTTLTSKVSNILQDTITQFDSGKISVTEYGDRLADFAKQQKALAKNAVEEAKALGIEGEELEQIKSKYEETENAIDGAIKKWEELRNVNKYLDENIETLNNATSTMSQGYQTFVSGLYQQFTQLSDDTKNSVLTNMQAMEGYANVSADNLLSTMKSNVGATKALASAIAAETTGTLNNVVNNGGKVLSALGNAIKEFDFSITFDPNAKFSGGEFDLIKWAKSGGKEGIRLPSITWDIKGSGGSSLQNLGKSLSDFGASMSSYSSNVDLSDYGGGGSGGNGNGNGGGGSGGNGKGSGSDKNKPDYEDPTEAIINRINLRSKELEQQEESIQNQIELAELENDYKKQISLTNDKLDAQRQKVDALKTANNELHQMAEDLRNSTPDWDEESWFNSRGEETQAYIDFINGRIKDGASKEEIESIKDQFEKISKIKKAWLENDEERLSLTKEILQTEKDIVNLDFGHSQDWIGERNTYNDWVLFNDSEIDAWERVIKRLKEDYIDCAGAAEKLKEAEESLFEARKEQFDKATDFASSYYDSQKTLLQSYFDVTNSIAEAQHEINKELTASKTMYEYLDEDTRKLLFNQEDYNALSKELIDIQSEADRLQRQYTYDLENSTLNTIEEITSNYEMQYEMLMKSYEIAKADLEVAKKKAKLDNVLNERNVRMRINGEWQYVANTQDVINAQSELADAEYAKKTAIAGERQEESINDLTAKQDKLGTTINLFEEGVIDLTTAVGNVKDIFGELPSYIDGIFNNILSSIRGSSGGSSFGGRSLQVGSDGNAPSGAKIGDTIKTDGGDYKIVSAGTKGATYNPSSGHYSIKVKEKLASGTRNTLGGATLLGEAGLETFIDNNGHLIPINQPTIGNIGAGGIVFNQDQMTNLRSLWDLSNVGTMPHTNISSITNRQMGETNTYQMFGNMVFDGNNPEEIFKKMADFFKSTRYKSN